MLLDGFFLIVQQGAAFAMVLFQHFALITHVMCMKLEMAM